MPTRRKAELIRPRATRPQVEFIRPRATYRLQLSSDFGFDEAARIAPYLAALGISHVYASPILAARPGSRHGYDIVDYGRLNDELGGEPGFERMIAALHEHDLGLILDFVPNHMGVGGDENPRWADILEWGEASPHANDFDIDWSPPERSLEGKLLLPFLGDHYGHALERGELVLELDDRHGSFSLRYFGHRFPIALKDYAALLRAFASPSPLADLAGAFASLAAAAATGVTGTLQARARALKGKLAAAAQEPAEREALAAMLASYRGDPARPRSFAALHTLLERQFYRLAYWRVATQEINYRRFFDINDLAGLRIEDDALFASVHDFVLGLIGEGRLDGLRIDHVDGLYDPAAYCGRLRQELDAVASRHGRARPWLVIEKILARHEPLRDWPVDGTTGYEFMNAVHGLFVAAAAEHELTRMFRRFTAITGDFDAAATAARREALANNLASELNVLAGMLKRIARRSSRSRDYTLADLRTALMAVMAHLPVYRTYVTPAGADDDDRRFIDWALARARRDHPQLERSVFDFVGLALRAEPPARVDGGPHEVLRFAMKSQQLSGAVAAKGVEDTAFYRYTRLVSLNEVGGDPARFGVSPAAFHHQNLHRSERHPYAMLSTASHDHKRGEDTRLRISALSEMADEWRKLVFRWTRLNRSKRRELDGRPAPDRNDEYLLYQTLVGVWPGDADTAAGDGFVMRLCAYMQKAVREAKRNSSWIAPNEDYEAAMEGFVRGVLDPARSRAFLASFMPFANRIVRIAAANGLSQTLLKLMSPGVPDVYQGADYWDLSLVDPDNRRPVDFAARRRSLASGESWHELAARWRTGEVKQCLIAQALELRKREPDLFTIGRYVPLSTVGEREDRLVAFARCAHDDSSVAVVVASRLNNDLLADDGSLRLAAGRWRGTKLELPAGLARRRYTDIFTNAAIPGAARLPVGELLGKYPVALLEAAPASGARRAAR